MVYKNAKLDKRTKQYNPSKSELLLEEICKSFGTELLGAEVNPINISKLVRISKPTIVEHPDGQLRLLQFQYTRFSPLFCHRALDIYKQNRAKEIGKSEFPLETLWKEVAKQHENWDSLEEVTNERYINHLKLHRWQKGLYFAVYDIKKEDSLKKQKPFYIHEPAYIYGGLPKVHIHFYIEPYFVIHNFQRENTENIYDKILINFPEIDVENAHCVNSGLSLHPLRILKNPENAFKEKNQNFGVNYEVHSEVPRQLTMGFIGAYLRKLCLDKDFY